MSFNRNPWVVAEGRYLDGLSDEDKALYKSASAENLLYSTSAAQIRHENNSRSRAAAKKLQPLVDAITQYGSAMDVICNTAPLFLSPIWGGLRVLLHIAIDFNKYYVKLIDMLERIGDVIPLFRSYERLFSKHEQLLYSLSAAYLDIITFCTDAKALFQKVKKEKTRFSIPGSGLRAMKLLWKPFEQDFGDTIEKFRRHTEKVGMEAQLAHMIEQAVERREQRNERDVQALERKIVETERERQLLLHKEQLRDNLLKRLSQYDHDYRHRMMKKIRIVGTGRWMLNSPEFITWLNETGSLCLWCYGIPGSGKSIVATVVVDAIKDDHLLDSSSLAWFYCDYSEPKTLEPSEIVGSLIKQLLRISLLTMSLGLRLQLEKIYENGRVPDLDELFDMFSQVIGELPKVFIIIDGLDECKENERDLLLPWLKKLSTSSATTVKLFVTSREEVDIRKAIGHSPSIQASGPNVSSDIAVVVEDLVKTRLAGKREWLQDPALVQEIIDTLIAGARGMFLWATLQLDDLCEEMSADGVRDALKRLPDGLNETFARALKKIHMRGRAQVRAARRLFMWLVGAKRVLTLEELQEAVSILPGDADLERGRIPDGVQLIRVCGSLVVYDPQENTIKLAHYTIQQFLLSQPSEFEISLQLPNFHFKAHDADIEAGQACMTYLCFSQFETQISRRTQKNISDQDAMLLGSPTTEWVPHMAGLSEAQTTMWNLFRGRLFSPASPTPAIDFTKHLYTIEKPIQDFSQFKFLDYVIEYWVEHAVSFTPDQPNIWRQFEHVTLERKLPFDFQPWFKDNPTYSSQILDAFRWALENGHGPLIQLIMGSSKYDKSLLSCALRNNEHPLCFASRMGHEQSLKPILGGLPRSPNSEVILKLDITDLDITDLDIIDLDIIDLDIIVESIKLATSNGHPRIAILLLSVTPMVEELKPGGRIDEVFKMALDNGHNQLADRLIRGFGFQHPQRSGPR